MKKLVPLLLPCLFFVNICFAQQRIEYANFVKTDTAIKWAAVYNSYVNLSPTNSDLNIRNFYVNKLKKQGAIAYLEDTTSFAVTPVNLNYGEYVSGIKKVDYDVTKMNWYFSFDEKPDGSGAIFNKDANSCDTCILGNKISLFKIKQLLYYKNSRLQIQNILLSPILYKKTNKTTKENTGYFETSNFAFNNTPDGEQAIPAAAKFIGRACNTLDLLPVPNNTAGSNILTLNNWALSSLLFKDIKQQKIKAYDTEKSIYPNNKSILDYGTIENYQNPPVIVPISDAAPGERQFDTARNDINFDSLYSYTLIQDFYFDFGKEKLYSKLIAFAPRLGVYTLQEHIFLGYKDYWGVIFPEEKKKVAKKTK